MGHPELLIGFIVAIVIVCSGLLWMNMALLSKSRQQQEVGPEPAETPQAAEHPAASAVADADMRRADGISDVDDASLSSENPDTDVAVAEAEVFDFANAPQPTVFGRQQPPYVLRHVDDSPFATEEWTQLFQALTRDSRVLGWIMFHKQQMIAADHSYPSDFLASLQGYQQSVERLRADVGLASVHEAFLIGDEGKVWFVSGGDDIWFALFLEHKGDARDLLGQLRTTPSLPV